MGVHIGFQLQESRLKSIYCIDVVLEQRKETKDESLLATIVEIQVKF